MLKGSVMYYSIIKNCDIANGEGVRVTLFVSGCRNHCKDCFQPETWNFQYGKPFTQDTINEILKLLKPDYIKGLTLLGGEPFEPENQKSILNLVKTVKEHLPNKDIWCFTGFTLDKEIWGISRASGEKANEILKFIDILVDGRFEADKKNLSLKFRGSSNQRIIDVPKSLASHSIVLSNLNN